MWFLKNKAWILSGIGVSLPIAVASWFIFSPTQPFSPSLKNGDQVLVNGTYVRGDSVKGDKVIGDKVLGDKVIVNEQPTPEYRIDIDGGSTALSGESVELHIRANQPKYLEGIACQWKFSASKLITLNTSVQGCDAVVTSAYEKFDRNSILSGNVNVTATVRYRKDVYEVITSFYITPDYNSNEYRDYLKSKSEARARRIQSVAEPDNNPADLQKSLEDASITADVHGDRIRANVKLPGGKRVTRSSNLEMSYDGGKSFFAPRTDHSHHFFSDTSHFFLRFVDSSRKELARIDATETFLNAIRSNITQRTKDKIHSDNRSGCSPFTCKFGVHSTGQYICSALVSEVAIRQGDTDTWATIDRSYCTSPYAQPGYPKEVCYDFERLPFSLLRDLPVSIKLIHMNGEEDIFRLPIKYDHTVYAGGFEKSKWVFMTPIEERNGTKRVPVALISFTPAATVVGGYTILFGGGGCEFGAANFNKGLLVDRDGKGLTRIQRNEPAFGPVHDNALREDPEKIKKMFSGDVEIGLGRDINGRRIGPFWYRFNAADPILRAAEQEPAASITCEKGGLFGGGDWVCFPKSRLGWIGVTNVNFGPTNEKWTHTINIEFDPATYLSTRCDKYKKDCPPFFFDVPKIWSDIYYQITQRDGTTSPVERIPIKL